MTFDPHSIDSDALLEHSLPGLATPVPAAAFVDRLEARLRAATDARGFAPSAAWNRVWCAAAAAVIVAAAAGLAGIQRLDETPAAGGVVASIQLSHSENHKHADERRMSLGDLVERSDLILSGRVLPNPLSGTYRLDVRTVLKGDGTALLDLSDDDSNTVACPGPPTWRADRWTVLFCIGGSVFSDQWKPEFDNDLLLQRFERRVGAYLDGSVLPMLMDELASGEGPGPFAEPDRLVIDAVPLLVAANDANGLFEVAQRFQLTGQSIDAIAGLAKVGGPEAIRALRSIRDGDLWPSRYQYRAIEMLAQVGGGLLDERTLAALLDPAAPYALRGAAARAVGHVGQADHVELLITLWSRIDDRSRGPGDDESGLKGSYVKADALLAIGRIGGKPARAFLIEVLQQGDDYFGYRARAADGLLELADPTVIPDLRLALEDPGTDRSSRGFITGAIDGLSRLR